MKGFLIGVIIFAIADGLVGQHEALGHEFLLDLLPDNIQGYSAGNPESATVNLEGVSFAQAEIKFQNQSGNYARVIIADYTHAETMYLAAIALWNPVLKLDSNEIIIKPFMMRQNINGWEEFRRNENVAIVALGVSGRFFITIEADNQKGTDLVKNIAQGLKLDLLLQNEVDRTKQF